jgi:hypothetical protein
MADKQSLKHEKYLGLFLLIVALMVFATLVKSCNIARYQAQHNMEAGTAHESRNPETPGAN